MQRLLLKVTRWIKSLDPVRSRFAAGHAVQSGQTTITIVQDNSAPEIGS
jgi:hypothetical protein